MVCTGRKNKVAIFSKKVDLYEYVSRRIRIISLIQKQVVGRFNIIRFDEGIDKTWSDTSLSQLSTGIPILTAGTRSGTANRAAARGIFSSVIKSRAFGSFHLQLKQCL